MNFNREREFVVDTTVVYVVYKMSCREVSQAQQRKVEKSAMKIQKLFFRLAF